MNSISAISTNLTLGTFPFRDTNTPEILFSGSGLTVSLNEGIITFNIENTVYNLTKTDQIERKNINGDTEQICYIIKRIDELHNSDKEMYVLCVNDVVNFVKLCEIGK